MSRIRRGSVMLLALIVLVGSATGADLMEDVDYRVIPKQSLTATERIEVVYFFYYGCQWCYRFEPYVNEWLKRKPVDVSFRRVPALRNTKWITLTRAYYTYDSLALLPRLHAKTFQTFHESDVDLTTESGLFDWVARQGVKRELFEETFHSEAISTQMLQSRALTNAFQIDSTPSVAVDGRYISDSGMTGGAAQLMDVVEGLVQMARDERRRRK